MKNLKLWIVIGVVIAGWTWSDGRAEALDIQAQSGSGPSERAQVPGAGDNVGRGTPHEGVGIGPSDQTSHGLPSTNNMETMGRGSGQMNSGTAQQGGERAMQSDPGRGGLPASGSAGSTFGGGRKNSLGSTSGGGSAGMGGSGGGASGGGGK